MGISFDLMRNKNSHMMQTDHTENAFEKTDKINYKSHIFL